MRLYAFGGEGERQLLYGGFTLKKIMKSFTFWCLIISVFEIFMHQIGQDSKSIVLIRINPISIYWYMGSVLTFLFYGIVLDGIKMLFRKFNRKRQGD